MKMAGIAAVLFVMLLLGAPAGAQDGKYRFPDPTLLVAPGASIGVRVRELSAEESGRLGVATGGVYVEEVGQDTPAERAGIKSGDIVTEFDGERVRSVRSLTRLVSETAPRRTVTAAIMRNGKRTTVEITPTAAAGPLARNFAQPTLPRVPQFRVLPLPAPGSPRSEMDPQRRELGITLSALDGQMADFFGVSSGVLVSAVERDSAAGQAGLKAGDVIIAVNGRTVRRAADVAQTVRDASPGSTLQMRIVRDKKEMTVEVVLPKGGGNRVPAPLSGSARVHV